MVAMATGSRGDGFPFDKALVGGFIKPEDSVLGLRACMTLVATDDHAVSISFVTGELVAMKCCMLISL